MSNVQTYVHYMESRLPQELYDEIISHNQNNGGTLRSLALVSKAWMISSRRHLFNAISVTGDQWTSPNSSFAKALDGGPSICLAVRVLRIVCGRSSIPSLVSLLERLPNLRSLYLHNVVFKPTQCTEPPTPLFDELEVLSCTFYPLDRIDDLADLLALSRSYLSVYIYTKEHLAHSMTGESILPSTRRRQPRHDTRIHLLGCHHESLMLRPKPVPACVIDCLLDIVDIQSIRAMRLRPLSLTGELQDEQSKKLLRLSAPYLKELTMNISIRGWDMEEGK